MKSKINVLCLFFLMINIGLYSQTVESPFDINLNLELTQPKIIPDDVLDTLLDPMSILTSSDTLNISAFMFTSDTLNLSKIHIKLGSTDGGSEFLTQTFLFDNTPSGNYTYERTGNIIKIGLGLFTYITKFYCEIYYEDATGNLSAVTKYTTD